MYNFSNDVIWFLDRDDFLYGDYTFFTEIWALNGNLESISSSSYSVITSLSNSRLARQISEFSTERRSLENIYVSLRYDVGISTPEGLAFIATSQTTNEKIIVAKLVFSEDWKNKGTDFYSIFEFSIPYMLVNDSVKIYPNINLYSKKSIYTPIGEELVSIGEHHHDVYSSNETELSGRRLISSAIGSQQSVPETNVSTVACEVGEYASDGSSSNILGYKMSDTSKLEDLMTESDIPDRILSDPELLADITEEFIAKNNSVQLLGHELRQNEVTGDLTSNNNLRLLTIDNTGENRNLCGLSIDTFKSWLLSSISVNSDTTLNLTTVISDIETSSNFTLKFTKASQIAIIKNTQAMGTKAFVKVKVYVGDTYIRELNLLPRHTTKIVSIVDGSNRDIFYTTNNMLERMYPVGSYYWTNSDYDPNYMFGGVWERPAATQGRFLYAIRSNNTGVGVKGGEPTHKLTTSEIPSHRHPCNHVHNFYKFRDNGAPSDSDDMRGDPIAREEYHDTNSGGGYWTTKPGTGRDYGFMHRSTTGTRKIWTGSEYFGLNSTTSSVCASAGTGSSYPHNNMPPYIVAYLWRRVG